MPIWSVISSTGERRVIRASVVRCGPAPRWQHIPPCTVDRRYSIGSERFFTGIVYDLSVQRALEVSARPRAGSFRSIFDNLPDAASSPIRDTGSGSSTHAFTHMFG